MTCGRLLVALFVAVAGVPSAAAAQSLVGDWEGSGHQTPAGPSGADYAIIMTIGDDGGSILYPSLECGGVLTRVSGDDTSAEYSEAITFGGCMDGGTIAVSLTQGRLTWRWTKEDAGQQYLVTGVLDRRE